MSSNNQVVITGIGLVTPIGNDTKESWHSLVNGVSGISKLDKFDTSSYTSKVVGSVSGEEEKLNAILTPAKQRKTERFINLALIAAHEAMNDSGLSQENPKDRSTIGSYFGVGVGGLEVMGNSGKLLAEVGPRKINPFLLTKAIMNEAVSWVSMEWNCLGPMLTFCNACASGTDAVGMAFCAIKHGGADIMLAGGTESCLNPLSYAAFGNMRALSTWDGDPKEASRPFDKDRNGFVMSEGAAVLVLERKDLALKRGAQIYAEIVGYGSSSDAYHIAAIHPGGRGGILSIKNALRDAKINPSEVGYINAHGTATPMNDPAETIIIKKVFGNHANPTNVSHCLISSSKSMTGHMLGATGAAEAAFSALAIKNQIVPPTINLKNPDETCDLDYVPNVARDAKIDYSVSNSFGFGGGNAVLVFKKV